METLDRQEPTNFNLERCLPKKKYERKNETAVSFSQQLLQFLCERRVDGASRHMLTQRKKRAEMEKD